MGNLFVVIGAVRRQKIHLPPSPPIIRLDHEHTTLPWWTVQQTIMSKDTRQASGGSGKAKRRWTDPDEDSRSNPADDYVAYPKRQRVSRACDSCRSKKDKCDGVQPVCSTCAALCRPCTYKTNPKKRGLPTGYIRTLELLWGLVFSKIQGSEDVVRALLKSVNIPSHLASMGKESEGSDTLVSSWKNSIVLKEIESLLILLEQPEEEQNKGRELGASPPESGGSISSDALEWQIPDGLGDARESSLPAIPSPVKTPTNPSTVKAPAKYITKDSGVQTSLSDSFLDKSLQPTMILSSTTNNGDNNLRLPSNSWPLLDIYFTYTQCWLPILEKHDILRTAFRYSEEDIQVSSSSPGSGNHAALWAALTLASFQGESMNVTRQLTDLPKDRSNPSHLYDTARRLIPSEDGFHEIGHVQALVILSLVKIGQQKWAAAWMLMGQAVRTSQYLGLNQPPTIQSKAAEDGKPCGRSKHVFLGCFILETLIATQIHQLPSLRKEDLTKIGPINEDGLEEWHPWEDQTGLRPAKSSRDSYNRGPLQALSTFNRLVSLVSLLNELCWLRQQQTTAVSQLELLEHQLQLWVTALPKSYRVHLQDSAPRLASPHVFGLEIMYEGIVTILGLELATHDSNRALVEQPRKRRAVESSKRLLLLLQAYMETYSLSATCPTFPMILTFGTQKRDETQLDFGLKNKLRSFSSHVASVWSVPEIATGGSTDGVQITTASTLPVSQQRSFAGVSPSGRSMMSESMMPQRAQAVVPDTISEARRMDMIDDNRTRLNVDPFLSNPWMRTPASIDESSALLQTPTPSLSNTHTTTGVARQPSQLNGHTAGRPHPLSATKQTPVLSDLPTPFQTTPAQCPPTYNDPNLNLDSFVDIDGYGPNRRQRIPPDLDALFDELASLDGTEK